MAEQKMPSDELIQKAMKCETPEQIIELAKTEDISLTKEEATAFLAQMQDIELKSEDLQKAAGGNCLNCTGRSWSCWTKCDCYLGDY